MPSLKKPKLILLLAGLLVFPLWSCQFGPLGAKTHPQPHLKPLAPVLQKLVKGAKKQEGVTLYYDPAYVGLAYPGGDVPQDRGVCTDVVIRAFRAAGLDLQKLVHEDMKAAFHLYPKKWGLKGTDKNIDHRRVPNLQTFFKRKGKSLPIGLKGSDYKPGDVVSWKLPSGLDHIGVVSDVWSARSGAYLVMHNIGAGARNEDILFSWKITGQYRYF